MQYSMLEYIGLTNPTFHEHTWPLRSEGTCYILSDTGCGTSERSIRDLRKVNKDKNENKKKK